MKQKYIYILVFSIVTFMITSCEDGQKYYNGVYISGAEGLDPSAVVAIDAQLPKTIDLVVASSEIVDKDVTIQLEIDEALVESYNKRFQTKYNMLPSSCYVLSHPVVTIKKGNFATTEPVKLNIVSTADMVQGRRYIVPVSIKYIGDYNIIEASKTVYVKLEQQIITAALDLSGSRYISLPFHEGGNGTNTKYDVTALPEVTMEARVFIVDYNNNSFNTIFGLEENFVLRTTTYGGGGGKLELAGGGMTNLVTPSPFPLKKWTHVAVTYNSQTMFAAIYIDGEVAASKIISRDPEYTLVNLTWAYESGWRKNPLFLGRSAGSRTLNGYVSETRVWARELSQADIKSNICAVDPTEPGLLGYWKFNENTPTTTYTDSSGFGYDATSNSAFSWVQNVKCPE